MRRLRDQPTSLQASTTCNTVLNLLGSEQKRNIKCNRSINMNAKHASNCLSFDHPLRRKNNLEGTSGSEKEAPASSMGGGDSVRTIQNLSERLIMEWGEQTATELQESARDPVGRMLSEDKLRARVGQLDDELELRRACVDLLIDPTTSQDRLRAMVDTFEEAVAAHCYLITAVFGSEK